MLLRFEATMNGRKFSQIADECILVDIVEDAADVAVETNALAGRDGMLISSRYRKSLRVTLSFVIREQDIRKRAKILQKVAEWAGAGGRLEINPRPGRYMAVDVVDPVALGSHLKWTEELQLTLTAYDNPYWETRSDHAITLSQQDDGTYFCADVFAVGGNVGKASAYMTLVALTGALTALKIVCGETMLEFAGLPDVSPAYIHITRENGIFRAYNMIDDLSLLPYRTAESDDELLADSGAEAVAVQVTADAPLAGSVVFVERWM